MFGGSNQGVNLDTLPGTGARSLLTLLPSPVREDRTHLNPLMRRAPTPVSMSGIFLDGVTGGIRILPCGDTTRRAIR